MQLRVARLCLDCEELHGERICPRCASERYAFLSTWLPSEERRRWPRQTAVASTNEESWFSGAGWLARTMDWLRGRKPDIPRVGPATRASDYAAQMKFDDPEEPPATRRRLDAHLSKNDVR